MSESDFRMCGRLNRRKPGLVREPGAGSPRQRPLRSLGGTGERHSWQRLRLRNIRQDQPPDIAGTGLAQVPGHGRRHPPGQPRALVRETGSLLGVLPSFGNHLVRTLAALHGVLRELNGVALFFAASTKFTATSIRDTLCRSGGICIIATSLPLFGLTTGITRQQCTPKERGYCWSAFRPLLGASSVSKRDSTKAKNDSSKSRYSVTC